MKLKRCESCDIYTLEETCRKCGQPTTDAHYKYLTQEKQNTEEE